MKSIDIMLLERCAHGPVSYTYAPNLRGKGTKLVRSTLSPKQREPLRALALAGYVAESVDPAASISPPESTVIYTLTALGRNALGIHAQRKERKYSIPSPSSSKLERESREPI